MNLNILELNSKLQLGTTIILKHFGYNLNADGIPVELYQRPGNLTINWQPKGCQVCYQDDIHYYRALGHIIEHYQSLNSSTLHINTDSPESIDEMILFDHNGPMVDVSRNAVPKISTLKKLLMHMALMGLNTLQLYMEDTFEMDNHPYFGYMRGRYTSDELHELDQYADVFGIEIVPCIQTLSHLERVLQWDSFEAIKDTSRILLLGNKATYAFIRDMISTVTKPFRSNRINVGLDEAHLLGLGKYLALNGYRHRNELMLEHLELVANISKKLDLKPTIWSDMFFRHATDTEEHYLTDTVLSNDVIQKKPENVRLAYWDYYHQDAEHYSKCIEMHKQFGEEPAFAGGLWSWNGLVTNYSKVFATTTPALQACKQSGVTEVIATIWGDDGNEGNLWQNLLGLQLYAEHGYYNNPSENHIRKRFEICCGVPADMFEIAKSFDNPPGTDYSIGKKPIYNPSKYLLWQDPLLGLFDKHLDKLQIGTHYCDLYNDLSQLKSKADVTGEYTEQWLAILNFYRHLSLVLSIKAELGNQLRMAYKQRDNHQLQFLVNKRLPDLLSSTQMLHKSHEHLWFNTYKAHGWEVLDIRYGGLVHRLHSTIKRLNSYIEGTVHIIEELEDERLVFDRGEKSEDMPLLNFNQYQHIITAGTFVL